MEEKVQNLAFLDTVAIEFEQFERVNILRPTAGHTGTHHTAL